MRKVEYKVENDEVRKNKNRKIIIENKDNWMELGYKSWSDYMIDKLSEQLLQN